MKNVFLDVYVIQDGQLVLAVEKSKRLNISVEIVHDVCACDCFHTVLILYVGHCPTGNDPLTSIDETDCTGLATPNGGYLTGVNGNKCFIECSNRGICNYKTGICRCFPGFTGYACQINDVFTS